MKGHELDLTPLFKDRPTPELKQIVCSAGADKKRAPALTPYVEELVTTCAKILYNRGDEETMRILKDMFDEKDLSES